MKSLITGISLLGGMFIQAWAIHTMWTWFVVPLGAPVIGMAHAYCLSTIITTPFTYSLVSNVVEHQDNYDVKNKDLAKAIGFIVSLLCMLGSVALIRWIWM